MLSSCCMRNTCICQLWGLVCRPTCNLRTSIWSVSMRILVQVARLLPLNPTYIATSSRLDFSPLCLSGKGSFVSFVRGIRSFGQFLVPHIGWGCQNSCHHSLSTHSTLNRIPVKGRKREGSELSSAHLLA